MDNRKGLTIPVIIDRYDTCVKCRVERSIELLDRTNRTMGYSVMLDHYEEDRDVTILNHRHPKMFKCKECGEIFDIHWVTLDTMRRVPKPLTNTVRMLYLILQYGGEI